MKDHLIKLLLIIILAGILTSKVFSQVQLLPPSLIYPEHKEKFEFAPTLFIWNPVEGAEHYGIQITTDVTFNNINYDCDIYNKYVFDTTYTTIANKLLIDTIYFWRVNATAGTDTSEWSFIRFFVTGWTNKIYEKYKNIATISLFPNPAQDYIIINITNNIVPTQSINLNLFNVNGEMINRWSNYDYYDNMQIEVDVSKYSPDGYTLLITNEKQKIIGIQTIIIKK